jgi:hypothetical protein
MPLGSKMKREVGKVVEGVVRVGGKDVAREVSVTDLGTLSVSAGLACIVRSTVGRSDRPAWMAGAASAFEEGVPGLVERAREAGVEIWWRPTCEDVLSDVPSTLTFFRKHPEFGLVLDPGALLTAEMIPRAEEHVERVLEALGGHEALRLVVARAGRVGEMVEARVDAHVAASAPLVWVGDGVSGVGLQ